jgi:DNA-directed RNA polymerase alpha subunit
VLHSPYFLIIPMTECKERDIKELALPTPLETTLRINRIYTIESLTSLCSCEVMELRSMEWEAYETIVNALHENNLSLSAKCATRQRMADKKNE